MRRNLVWVTLLANFVLLAEARGQVILNEVLANEPGSSTALEWVELYNSDSLAVTLGNWVFVEGSDTTALPGQQNIPARGYLILARKLTDTFPGANSFEARWGNGSGVWGDAPEENYPAIEAKMSLTNSGGTVTLIAPDNSAQSFSWAKDAGDGISWEKVDYRAGDDTANWKVCQLTAGSTPGKINSVGIAENDLAIVELAAIPANPGANQQFSVGAKVLNAGTKNSSPNVLLLFDDQDFNGAASIGETLGTTSIPALLPADSFGFNLTIALPEGNHRLVAEAGPDDKNYNNRKSLDLKVGQALASVILNEIMAAPDLNRNQTEWVELYNRSAGPINLSNWRLGDAIAQNAITGDILELNPGEFLVIAEDKNKFLATYIGFAGQVFEQTGWRTLDNDGDEVILIDSPGFLAEKVSYPAQNLKGISWERIDYDRIPSDSNNWWRCVDSAGATPGRQNSVQAAFSSSIELKIEPNPFSPDEDGFDDQTEIEFKIPLGVDLTIKIYDRKGRLVRTLLENEPKVSGKISWDGKKDDGTKVRSGIYILFVEAQGETREVKKETIAVIKGR